MSGLRYTIQPNERSHSTWRTPERVLLICYYDPAGVPTVPETVAYMQRFSRFAVTIINLFVHRPDMGYLKLPDTIDLDAFQVIIIHNSVSYNVDNLKDLDSRTQRKFADFAGVKVLMKQDENYRHREIAEFIGQKAFDLVLTCLPENDVRKVYPKKVVGGARFTNMLTGYVTPALRGLPSRDHLRSVDIGYRGSIQDFSFGRLAYEKRSVGEQVQRRLTDRGVILDISSRWEDRLGADAWIAFLLRCRATLGAESGASIFDLDGDLTERCRRLEAALGPTRMDDDYAEAFLKGLADLENNVDYAQISPRHFEAAACRTAQILLEGRYSGIFEAGRHFIPLKRDYSNLDEAVAWVMDEGRRGELVERAYDEIILCKTYWIETFVRKLDEELEVLLGGKGARLRPLVFGYPAKTNTLLIAAHDPGLDPRLDWIEECAPYDMSVHILGSSATGKREQWRATGRGAIVTSAPRRIFQPSDLEHIMQLIGGDAAGRAALGEIQFILYALASPPSVFAELFGAPFDHARMPDFRWYLNHLLNTTATLLDRMTRMVNVDVVIATDLDTVIPALLFKSMTGAKVLFDSHEYWSEADVRSLEFEKVYWRELEARLMKHVDYAQTVSPGLAEILASETEVRFDWVPNCEPIRSLRGLPAERTADGANRTCAFLFQGNFAPCRGIEYLIEVWSSVDANAQLQLRGPDNEFKREMMDLAANTGLLGTRILFPEAVKETALVEAAAAADVGIIPYPPVGTNYSHCSPNKLSQYMAAGLPVLANRTSFVTQIVADSEAGLVCDFSNRTELLDAVNALARSQDVREVFARKANDYFRREFHWEKQSRSMYEAISTLADARRVAATMDHSTSAVRFALYATRPPSAIHVRAS